MHHLIVKIVAFLVALILLAGLIYATNTTLNSYTSRTEHSLQAAIAGECFRVNYLRWQVDISRFNQWHFDQTYAHLNHQVGKFLLDVSKFNHKFSTRLQEPSAASAVARIQREQMRIAHNFTLQSQVDSTAANHTMYLPLTNCKAALASPLSYHPPLAVPFSKLSQAQLKRLKHAPTLSRLLHQTNQHQHAN